MFPAASITQAFIFASLGDAQLQSTNLKNTAVQINGLNPDFAIFNGDLGDNGYSKSELDTMTSALNCGGSCSLFNKTFLVRGNHDTKDTSTIVDASSWQSYFAAINRPLPPGISNYIGLSTSSTYLNYSFDYGNSRFIGLDTNDWGDLPNATQLSFLDSRLTNAESLGLTHAFIYFHAPAYCVESTHCSCSTKNDSSCTPSALITIINKHPIVSATFHGHEHILGWTHMDNTRVAGLTHPYEQFITSPSGGWTYNSYLYGGTSTPTRMEYAYPLSSSAQGFGTITVDGLSFTMNIYKVGQTAPVWTKTFTKPGAPSSSPSPTPSPTPSPSAKPGDANGDGKTDGIDYFIWLNHYNQAFTGPTYGDFNKNSIVDGVDYVIWLNNYGK